MPGFVIHSAIAQEYLRKHSNIENAEEFIKGNMEPDLTSDKTKTHYGKSPTYTNLKEFLENNTLDNSFNKGMFLHLIADYLFYNYYLRDVPRKESKEILHNDYDLINKKLIEKYDIELLEYIKKYVFYKNGEPKILTLDFIEKVIDDISSLNLESVKGEVLAENKEWSTYKKDEEKEGTLGYLSGIYDILRINDLERIDRAIQENLERGNKYFALAIYDDKLCEEEGLSTPVKNVNDRMKIAQYLSGVDFTFSISSTDSIEISKKAQEAFEKYMLQKEEIETSKLKNKKYDIVYVPGTYDLFHAGHLENLLEASNNSERIIVGVKSDELVEKHKGRQPIISAQERMEILRHFEFVNGVYQYHTRDPHVAATWIKAKYGKDVDAIFLGSDLKNDFKDIKDIEVVFTDRDPSMTRSTTNYRKKLTLLKPTVSEMPIRYTGNSVLPIEKEIKNVNKDGEER